MAFNLIRISNLRNLTDCEIAPHDGINLVQGDNGSGKTSLLESIYILGRGRSFRDKQLINAIQRGKNSFTLFGKKGNLIEQSAIGINYSEKGGSVRINGKAISKLSLLAKETPVHIITPRSHEIIENGSAVRRRFLEWGVFHVEPLYQHFSSRYQRALGQRNSALRNHPISAGLWNKELVESGLRLQEYRNNYFGYLKTEFVSQLRKLNIDMEIDISLYRGWSKEKSLQEILEESFPGDEKRCFTQMGPHRADIIFRLRRKALEKWSSRGQLKLLILALFIAQAKVIKLLAKKEPILLVDDLTAELDRRNVEKVIDLLIDQGNQIFITTTDLGISISKKVGKMFHVEHGVVEEQRV